jgi:tetrahydromethanopterin S-methyltransferase subunit H
LDIARDAGIKNILLDTASTPFGQHAADSLRAIPVFKSEFGLPTGCALHNTLESWGWMRDYRKKNRDVYEAIDIATAAMIPEFSGDYTIYGPIDNAPKVFPAVAFVDKLIAEGGSDFFGTEIKGPHPWSELE